MKFVEDARLADYTSLKAGGTADLVIVEPGDKLASVLAQPDFPKPITVLGYGCNVLVSDHGLEGTVVLNQTGQINEVGETSLCADSGVKWDELVQSAIERGLWGLELMSGIPGGVGAAIVGNIAAYGQPVADTLSEVKLLNTKTGQAETWPAERLGLKYRSSDLQLPTNQHLVLLEATFKLSKQTTHKLEYDSALKTANELGLATDDLANRRKIILETRKRAGALLDDVKAGPWTAGSFFKNPVVSLEQVDQLVASEEFGMTRDQLLNQNRVHGGNSVRVSAAHVLLAAGFKRGQTWGPVRLHPQHILKIENTGAASAQEIYNVAQEIIETVQAKLKITLEPEVRFLGQF